MDAACTDDAQKTRNEPLIQYRETDWEFLKRLGSHLNIPVYADCESGSRVLYFGMEEGRRIGSETVHPEHLSVQGSGGQAALCEGSAVTFGSNARMELTASGLVRMEAEKIHAYTPAGNQHVQGAFPLRAKRQGYHPKRDKEHPLQGQGMRGSHSIMSSMHCPVPAYCV